VTFVPHFRDKNPNAKGARQFCHVRCIAGRYQNDIIGCIWRTLQRGKTVSHSQGAASTYLKSGGRYRIRILGYT
jgi:hypothetical protein